MWNFGKTKMQVHSAGCEADWEFVHCSMILVDTACDIITYLVPLSGSV